MAAKMPVLGKQASPSRRRVGWNVEHTAQRQAMPHVAGGPFLRRQVAVVLRVWRAWRNHDDPALRLDRCLGFVVAADEFSALGAMSIGIFPRPAVGTHFELSRAATWTRAILGLVSPPTAKRGA
jgi:hypothetical protein